ncbi:MarR family winged helix-turn-helix transcriptional regulator [Embleya scabrispora]|uniref:MarR family winged helix-turn-helix transcriptional regulator n=1 Tax=Embleya scabrispora TaxID=159449 RepID=UPI00037BB169|nr:MarR family winged helix-turn-helix transcriptional regulator [Embleya scabrispora]MYS87960.1 MarR family transcriptional regulator [Streptomyces sp. SID5474]
MDFGLLLGRAYEAFVQELHAHLAARGFPIVGASYGYVLRTLDGESVTATQLGERLGITAQGAAKIVDEMVAAGCVERRPDPADGRAKRLYLAPRGREMLDVVRAFHADFEHRLTARAGAQPVAITRETLTRIVADAPGSDPTRIFRSV